jgi:hypothetical protein
MADQQAKLLAQLRHRCATQWISQAKHTIPITVVLGQPSQLSLICAGASTWVFVCDGAAELAGKLACTAQGFQHPRAPSFVTHRARTYRLRPDLAPPLGITRICNAALA